LAPIAAKPATIEQAAIAVCKSTIRSNFLRLAFDAGATMPKYYIVVGGRQSGCDQSTGIVQKYADKVWLLEWLSRPAEIAV